MRSVWGSCGCEANDSACVGTVGADIAVWVYTRKELETGVIQHSYFRLGESSMQQTMRVSHVKTYDEDGRIGQVIDSYRLVRRLGCRVERHRV